MPTDDYFKDWSASQLADRLTVLQRYEDGWDSPTMGAALAPLAFPNGRDPDNHPEDNLERVRAALSSRMPDIV